MEFTGNRYYPFQKIPREDENKEKFLFPDRDGDGKRDRITRMRTKTKIEMRSILLAQLVVIPNCTYQ